MELTYYQRLGISLDLALEAHELLRGKAQREIPGVKEEKQQLDHATITKVTILNDMGQRIMGKAMGTYVTIEAPALRQNNMNIHQQISTTLAERLKEMVSNLEIGPDAPVLLVGLGNWGATPDALGPRVIDTCLVTRHLHQYAPQELQGGLRPVSALAPGVLGITGIETAEIIKGVIDRIRPALIIAVDALAARNLNRISTTIQLADTGINPGSGVGNKRMGITKEAMGVPVIAIGVPTVVHAAVIVFEAFEQLMQSQPTMRNTLAPQTIESLASQILQPFGGNLTVTPKEIDDLIKNTARVIASGINQGLHQSIGPHDFATYLQ